MLKFLINWWLVRRNERLILRAVEKELAETDFLVFPYEANRDFLWVRKPMLAIVGYVVGDRWLGFRVNISIAGKTVEQVLADLPSYIDELEEKMRGNEKSRGLKWVD